MYQHSALPLRAAPGNAYGNRTKNIMRLRKNSFAAMSLAGALAGFAGISPFQAENAGVTYKAELSPLNSKTTGSSARGEATFTISGDRLTIHVTAKGAPPNMEHLQHFHGFAKGDRTSRCRTTRDDKNRDGIIDIVQTNPVAGTTMVPFEDDPAGMAMVNDTFLRAGMDGSYSYEKIVSLKALEAARSACRLPARDPGINGASCDGRLA